MLIVAIFISESSQFYCWEIWVFSPIFATYCWGRNLFFRILIILFFSNSNAYFLVARSGSSGLLMYLGKNILLSLATTELSFAEHPSYYFEGETQSSLKNFTFFFFLSLLTWFSGIEWRACIINLRLSFLWFFKVFLVSANVFGDFSNLRR